MRRVTQLRRVRGAARGASLAVGLALSTLGSRAAAQTSLELATRSDLLHRAQEAANHHSEREALTLAEEALRIQSSPSLRLFIAERQRALHHPAQAFVSAELCEREALRDAVVPGRENILASCRALAAQLRREVAFVRVRIAGDRPEGVAVRIGNELLPESLVGLPVPAEPGEVTIVVGAPGRVTFSTTMRLTAGLDRAIEVELPLTAPRGDTAPVEPAPASPPVAIEPSRPARADRPAPGRAVPVAPIVVASVGAVGLVVGGVLGAMYSSSRNAFERRYCGRTGSLNCSEDGREAYDSFVGLAVGANVSFIAGGVVLAGGATWALASLLQGRSARERASSCAPSWGGVSCEVRF